MGKTKLELSKENGAHYRLNNLAGKWKGVCHTWFEKDILADSSEITGTFDPILNGNFMNFQYAGTLTGKNYSGLMTWGYDLDNDQCVCSWADSFHMSTGIMRSQGTFKDGLANVLGSYSSLDYPESWGWRTELEMISAHEFRLTAWNVSPDGDEAKATETLFSRAD